MIEFWEDHKDIRLTIANKMNEFNRDESLAGWVRGGNETSPAVTNELARLSEENAELRKGQQPTELFHGLTFEEMMGHLEELEVVDVMLRSRDEFSARLIPGLIDGLSDDKFWELVYLGLIERSDGSEFLMSSDGRNLLNRLWHLKKAGKP